MALRISLRGRGDELGRKKIQSKYSRDGGVPGMLMSPGPLSASVFNVSLSQPVHIPVVVQRNPSDDGISHHQGHVLNDSTARGQ